MKKTFDKIKLSHLYTLCRTIADTRMAHESYIKQKYLETAQSFEETLSFLETLKIVKRNSEVLLLSKLFISKFDSYDDFKQNFVLVLFSVGGEISEQLINFLANFQVAAHEIFFKASEIEKIKFSDTRNLLLELEFISASIDNTTYFVNLDHTDLFEKQFSRKSFLPESLKSKQIENESIGLAAEKAVIEFEKKRLTRILIGPNEIEHTSQWNVLAGYDIKSFENHLDNNSNRITRFIEVKAVSIKDFKFYWSINEIEMAKIFREMYFLYLLPVGSNNTFAFEKLMIVNNPFSNIYANGLNWNKREESISFSKKTFEKSYD